MEAAALEQIVHGNAFHEEEGIDHGPTSKWSTCIRARCISGLDQPKTHLEVTLFL